MAARFATHGRILCGTVATPQLGASLADYVTLGFRVVEDAPLAPALAESWGAHALDGRRAVLLQAGPEDSFLRLIETTPVRGHAVMRGLGWIAFELTVADVFALRETMRATGFTITGEPRRVEGFDSFIPFQVSGRAGETLYLNQVLNAHADGITLPHAQAAVDRIFIAVIGARDLETTLTFLTSALRLERGGAYEIPLGVLNRAHGLAPDTRHRIAMTRKATLPVFEVDQLPAPAERPQTPGELPPGCAFATIAIDSFDAIEAPLAASPARRPGALYRDRRTALAIGPDNLLIELVEAA